MATPLKIVIYIDESELKEPGKDSIREAIRSFFAYKIELQTGELKTFVKRAQLFLLIGLFVLGLCIGIAQNLTTSASNLMSILKEGVVIFGWYPLWETLRFYKKLVGIEIDIHFWPATRA